MFDPELILGQMFSGAMSNAFGNRSYSVGNLIGGNKLGLGLGLLGIAIAAMEHNGMPNSLAPTGTLPPPPPLPAAPPPPPTSTTTTTRELPILSEQQQNAVLLIRAMIAAANADGQLDSDERQKILAAARHSGINAENEKFLEVELSLPHSAEQIIAASSNSLAKDVYAASLAAIVPDTPVERAYLDKLAKGLGLSDTERQDIHHRLGIAN